MFNAVFLDASPVWFVVITVAVSLGPGVAEELFFRGFVLRAFRPSMPAWLAVLLSSAMFGLIHLDPLQSPGAGLIGLYLGFVALIAGSLFPAMVAHALNNLVCALVARFGGPEISQVWSTGHSPWILVGALVLTGASTFALIRLRGRWTVERK
jgi:membrane protease YdiL (CAAX protease family)